MHAVTASCPCWQSCVKLPLHLYFLYAQSDSSLDSGPGAREIDVLDEEEDEAASRAFKLLDDLPLEAVISKTRALFSSAARRHYMGLFPHATSGEINQIVTKKWQVLKDTTRSMPDELESYLMKRQGKKGTFSHSLTFLHTRDQQCSRQTISVAVVGTGFYNMYCPLPSKRPVT